MSKDNTRLTDYETKEKLSALEKHRKEEDPLEPQWDYDGVANARLDNIGMPVSAHWPECWRVHHECAVELIDGMQIELAELRDINKALNARECQRDFDGGEPCE